MTKPPHAVPPSSLRLTPAGASTARPSHAPAPPYHLAVQTRRRVTNRTHGRPAAGTPRRRTSRCRRMCLFLCPPFTTPAPARPSPQSRPCLFMFRVEAGAGHASPSSPDRGRRGRHHSSKRQRRIALGPRRPKAQIRTQSRSEPRKSRSGTYHTSRPPFHGASVRRGGSGRRQMYCTCSCACFCDRVCPTLNDRGAKANTAQPTPCLVPSVCRQLQLRVSPSCTGAQAHD